MNYQDKMNNFEVYDEQASLKMAFLQKVYITFLFSLLVAAGGAIIGLRPAFLKFAFYHSTILFIITIIALFGAYACRKMPGINIIALFAFTFLSGMSLSPIIALYLTAGKGMLIHQALILTGVTFSGLSLYVFITKQDFSFLGGFLFMGIFALIGTSLVFMIFGGSSGAYTIYCAFGALLFCGFILYDTSKLLREWRGNDYVGFAIQLYLDFLNLFLFILRILGGSRD